MLRVLLLAISALITTLLLAYSALVTPSKISPQGCRMSYMSPSYILQTGFNASWTSTSLASRYRLMLYREVGWDPQNELRGVPVLFIPGNAGSGHQVRSIASSATRQYYLSPSQVNPIFSSRNLNPLDIFAVDFNEDLSAFHGPTLASQCQYSRDAVSYILSLYPPDTRIVILGHSMGGLVATALLPASQISAVITMSTPHSVPPARFDSRMDALYKDVQVRLSQDSTPILSLCGGITDTMIPSEFCSLPLLQNDSIGYRKTIFTSSLEGCWSGVGHREMVWCHQVRWRVARAVLELTGARTVEDMSEVFDHWFRDGLDSPSHKYGTAEPVSLKVQGPTPVSVESLPLTLRGPRGSHSYKLTLPETRRDDHVANLVAYVSQGSLNSMSPADASSLKASIRRCWEGDATASLDSRSATCEPVEPAALKLIPNPDPNKPFPAPHEGVGELDGVVVFTARLPLTAGLETKWISVDVQNEGSRGWVITTIEDDWTVLNYASLLVPFFSDINIILNPSSLHTKIHLPNLLSDVLIIYRAHTKLSGACRDALLPPILLHTSGPHEGHYHRLAEDQPIFLHGHSSAPFLPLEKHLRDSCSRGLNLSIFSSGDCSVETLTITVDWWHSLGRWGARYWNAILAWSTGIVCFLFYLSWSVWDGGASMPSPFQSLVMLTRLLPKISLLFMLVSFLPLPRALWLGNAGEPIFAFLAPFILLLSCGLVILSWIFLCAILLPYGKLVSLISRTSDDNPKEQRFPLRLGLLTIAFMSLLVFLFIPWQVAFLACYLIHLHHCALLLQAPNHEQATSSTRNQKLLMILAMSWCLPVVVPVLAVWVRTLATAGLTTPFDGDHFVLNSLSFVALTYAMATTRGPVFQRRHRYEVISVPQFYALGALVAFLVGPRSTYRMYEALNWPMFALFCFRVAPRFSHGMKRAATTNISGPRARELNSFEN